MPVSVPRWLRGAQHGVLDARTAAEIHRRQATDGLTLADMWFLLLGQLTGEHVPAVRAGVLSALGRVPHQATSIVSMHTEALGVPPAAMDVRRTGQTPHQHFSAQARVVLYGREYTGLWCTAQTKKAAEHRARLSLLAALADVSQPSGTSPGADTGQPHTQPASDPRALAPAAERPWKSTHPPVMVLNELQAHREIHDLHYDYSENTAGGGPRFTAHATCRYHDTDLSASGTAQNKQRARRGAAAALLDQLIDQRDQRSRRHKAAPPTVPAPTLPPAAGEPLPDSDDAHSLPAPRPAPDPPSSSGPDAQDEQKIPAETATALPSTAPGDREHAQDDSARLRPVAASTPLGTVRQALEDGAELLFAPGARPRGAFFLWHRRRAQPPTAVPPEAVCVHEILLDGGEVQAAHCWRADTAELLHLLAAPHPGWSATSRLWQTVAQLALETIQEGRIRPDFVPGPRPDTRDPVWKPVLDARRHEELAGYARALAAQPRCRPSTITEEPEDVVRAAIDALTEDFVPAPGHPYLLGNRPFAAPVHYDGPLLAVQEWADDLADAPADPHAAPGPAGAGTEEAGLALGEGPGALPHLVLRITEPEAAPTGEATGDALPGQLRAVLRLSALPDSPDSAVDAAEVWHGHPAFAAWGSGLPERIARALRRAGRTFPPLLTLGMQEHPTMLLIGLADAARLRGGLLDTLHRGGLSVEWHKGWAGALDVEAVIGTGSATPVHAAGPIGLGEALDRRWQLRLDGERLTDRELALLADAAMPCIRLRNRWVLLDDTVRDRARHSALPPVPGYRALIEALYGQITLDGEIYACRPADGLREIIGQLRTPAPAFTPPAGLVNIELLPFQQEAVAWLPRLAALGLGGILGHQMGLGKTAMALAHHLWRKEHHHPGPTLVICPHSAMRTWREDLQRYAPDVPVRHYTGPHRTLTGLGDEHLVLTTYDLLRRDHAELAGRTWGLVVADEAQKIKNPGTHVARLIRSLKSTTRLASTGTPMENCPEELWALLDWCNPELFGRRADFLARYVRPTQSLDPTAASRARERLQHLLAPFLLRRIKSDPELGLTFPDKNETTHAVPLSEEQVGLYEGLDHDTMQQIQLCPAGRRRGELTLNLIAAFRKICVSPALYRGEPTDDAAADPYEAARRAPKLALLHDLLHPIREAGEAALIYTTFREAVTLIGTYLQARGFTALLHHGGLTDRQRTHALDTFTTGQAHALILTPYSGGTGLNLTAANHVIHYDRVWNPALEAQCNDRVHRLTQTRPVTIHYLAAAGSIEDRVGALLDRKRHLTEQLLPDGGLDFTRLTPDELIALCRLTSHT